MITVGIDVDGVLRNFVKKVREYCHTNNILSDPFNSYNSMYYIEHKGTRLSDYIYGDWLEDIWVNSPIYKGAYEAYLKFIRNSVFTVYIVSSQKTTQQKALTDLWLDKHEFNKHYRTIYTMNKIDAPCQILIDDSVKHIKNYENANRMGILINRTYNRDSDVRIKAKNLNEAYEVIGI